MAGAVLEWVWVDKAIAMGRQRAGHCGRAPRAGALHEVVRALGGPAMHPLAQRGIGNMQRVRDRGEAVPLHDGAHGWGTPEHPGLLGLGQAHI